jgi:hypothetical protein
MGRTLCWFSGRVARAHLVGMYGVSQSEDSGELGVGLGKASKRSRRPSVCRILISSIVRYARFGLIWHAGEP